MNHVRSIASDSAIVLVALIFVAVAFRFGLLPPEVYGALLGALLTLLGVHLKSRYDMDAKRLELVYGLRRDVYLEAAEGLARSLSGLLRLAQPDSDSQAAGPPAPTETWLQKLELVATAETVTLARDAAKLHAKSVFDLMKGRAKFQKLEFDLKTLREHRDRLYEQQRETTDEFTRAIAETNPDLRDARFTIVEDRRRRVQQALDSNHDDDERKYEERERERRELARTAIRSSVDYLRKVSTLQNAIRREITLEGGPTPDIPPAEPEITEEQLDDFAEYLNSVWRREDAG